MTRHNKSAEFYEAIEKAVSGGSTVMDSIVEYCELRGLEVESVVPLVNRNAKLLSRLRDEAEATNSIERVAHLPI
jgi:hypothetical protein